VVLLDPLSPAAAVPALAAKHVGVDACPVDGQTRRQALDEGHEGRAVRFAGCADDELGHGVLAL
jgi:hypothetical protein